MARPSFVPILVGTVLFACSFAILRPNAPALACTCAMSSTDSTAVSVSADSACQTVCADSTATELNTTDGYDGYCSCEKWSDCETVCSDAGYYATSGDQYCFLYDANGGCVPSSVSSTIFGTDCDTIYLNTSSIYFGIYDGYAKITRTVGVNATTDSASDLSAAQADCTAAATAHNAAASASSSKSTANAPQPSFSLFNPLGRVDLNQIIGTVVKGILGLAGGVALFVCVWGGILMLTSGGMPDRIKKGKQALIWATAGLALMFMAYALLSTLIDVLSTGA